jgi:hypothetical protein
MSYRRRGVLCNSYVRKIWGKSKKRFVISEAMQQYFSEFYGGHCEALNNFVTFNECYPEPIQSDRLRIACAGSMHFYYLDSMSMVLKELCGLGDQLTRELGERAYYFGRERHNKTTNSARLWQALFQVYESPRNSCK